MGEPISGPVSFVFNDVADISANEGAISQGLNDSYSGIITAFQGLLKASVEGDFEAIQALLLKKASYEENFQAYIKAKKELEEFKKSQEPSV